MAFKLIESAQDRWRAVNAPHLVALVRAGPRFEKAGSSNDPTNQEVISKPRDTPIHRSGLLRLDRSSPPRCAVIGMTARNAACDCVHERRVMTLAFGHEAEPDGGDPASSDSLIGLLADAEAEDGGVARPRAADRF
jgi:hypothetical protein